MGSLAVMVAYPLADWYPAALPVTSYPLNGNPVKVAGLDELDLLPQVMLTEGIRAFVSAS